MPQLHESSVRNLLLASLSDEDFALVRPHLEPVKLAKGVVLVEPNQPIPYAWFPDSGLGSVIAISPEGHKSEVGIFGHDGLAGSALLLATDRSPQQTIIQAEGNGHRIACGQLQRLIGENGSLRELLLRYVQAFATQTSHTALSNATHTVEERLARWLLMSHDRTDGDALELTHDFLALMLAVRRPSVTTALHTLESMAFVRNTRGRVVIQDREGLESLAIDAYGIPEAEYERLIAPLRKSARTHDAAAKSSVVRFKRD